MMLHPFLVVALLFTCSVIAADQKQVDLVLHDVSIKMDIPEGYIDSSEKNELPSRMRLLETRMVEPWKKAGGRFQVPSAPLTAFKKTSSGVR